MSTTKTLRVQVIDTNQHPRGVMTIEADSITSALPRTARWPSLLVHRQLAIIHCVSGVATREMATADDAAWDHAWWHHPIWEELRMAAERQHTIPAQLAALPSLPMVEPGRRGISTSPAAPAIAIQLRGGRLALYQFKAARPMALPNRKVFHEETIYKMLHNRMYLGTSCTKGRNFSQPASGHHHPGAVGCWHAPDRHRWHRAAARDQRPPA